MDSSRYLSCELERLSIVGATTALDDSLRIPIPDLIQKLPPKITVSCRMVFATVNHGNMGERGNNAPAIGLSILNQEGSAARRKDKRVYSVRVRGVGAERVDVDIFGVR